MGDAELAFEIFRELGTFASREAIWLPIHRAIRQLPAFKTWIRDIGLYDYWRTSGKWGDFCRPVGEDDFVCD